MRNRFWLCGLAAGLLSLPTTAGVVINEIFYHAPDDFDDLEWIELHNPEKIAVDLSGWKLKKGVSFTFPAKTEIAPGGFLVVAKDKKLFGEFYPVAVTGEFTKSMSNSGESIELADANGKTIDQVTFTDRAPWPEAADGKSSSLERISPLVEGSRPENWDASPLPTDAEVPAGTPGKVNAAYSAKLPPVIRSVVVTPMHAKPGSEITVEAEVEGGEPVKVVEARYRAAKPGEPGSEKILGMKREGDKYRAKIAGVGNGELLRIQIRAMGESGATRLHPSANSMRPAVSVFVHEKVEAANIPLAWIIHTDAKEFAKMEGLRKQAMAGGGNPFGGGMWQIQQVIAQGVSLPDAWLHLTLEHEMDEATYGKIRKIFSAKKAERDSVVEKMMAAGDMRAAMRNGPAEMRKFSESFVEAMKKELPPERRSDFEKWLGGQQGEEAQGMGRFLKGMVDVEGIWFAINEKFEMTPKQLAAVRPIFKKAYAERAEQIEAAKNLEPSPQSFPMIQAKFGEVQQKFDQALRTELPLRQRRFVAEHKSNQGSPMRPQLTETPPRAPRGTAAFVYVDAKTGKTEVYDFIHVTDRTAGYKVRFHSDRLFQEMSTANVIFEYNDRFTLAEPLAFRLYNDVGNAASKTDFVRLNLNGHTVGYHLIFEQVNSAFLRRNKLKTDGELYKILWYGNGVEGQHEKQNAPDRDHSELVKLIESLRNAKGAEQWEIIQKNFNVDQVINYFSVNMVLSHWDGFFNNYFTYYDRGGSKKWEMYPWDQDKTWGFHDASGEQVFFDMPLTFGMEGDRPPGGGEPRFDPSSWWRPGGFFSAPLLANEEFRKRYLARTKEILEKVYTEEKYFPIIDAMADRLKPEVPIRAKARGEDPAEVQQRFERNVASLKEHLTKRREFLLKQPELKGI